MTEKPLIYLGTTAEKEGLSEEDFRKRVEVVKEQMKVFQENNLKGQ